MTRVYIDVTNLIYVDYLTGIQRVVREVVLRMLKRRDMELVLLNYQKSFRCFTIVDNHRFYDYFVNGTGEKQELAGESEFKFHMIQPGDVFYDIDSVWNTPMRRSVLLPEFKSRGAKITVFVHDILPITHPEYCADSTVVNYVNYMGAYLQFADMILSSTQSTLDEIRKLEQQLEVDEIPCCATGLGADFMEPSDASESVSEDAIRAAKSGKYVLMVGTIEPRKNHSLILDAFDQRLFELGYHLILVGKIGWQTKELEERINRHPNNGKKLFHLKGMNDATVDYLYRHAYCVAFPSFCEGYGLPMVEALERGTPLIAADIPVLREVGGEYASYCSCTDPTDFANLVTKWDADPELYRSVKERVAEFRPKCWDDVAEEMCTALLSLRDTFPYPEVKEVRQIVYLSSRAEDLLETLPFVEHFMPFIEEALICCPDSMVEEMKQQYHGRLRLSYLTDSVLLDGKELPEDHACRNFFLRCCIVRRPEVHDLFLMSDDDCRPLYPIEQNAFLNQDRYVGYVCYMLDAWKGKQGMPTSFDQSMYRTYDHLKAKGYTTWMYDSHMMQLFDRRVYLEMLDHMPEIAGMGLSDWSMYFNYLATTYASKLENRLFASIAWPGLVSGWDMILHPSRFLFENYYRELYEEGQIFEQFSETYYDGVEMENYSKIAVYLRVLEEHNQARSMFRAYQEIYELEYGEAPLFMLSLHDAMCEIGLPNYVAISENNFVRIPFLVCGVGDKEMVHLTYQIYDANGTLCVSGDNMELEIEDGEIQIPIKAPRGGINGMLRVIAQYRDKTCQAETVLRVMKKGMES